MKNLQKFQCPACGKRYKYKHNYRSHYRIHTDDAFVCKYCGKRFGRRGNYVEHLRVHTGEAPFKCNYCCQAFKQKHGYDLFILLFIYCCWIYIDGKII